MSEIKPETFDAMTALFAFSEAMEKGITMADLTEIMTLSIESGHDMFLLVLEMAQVAIKRAKENLSCATS